jgi:cytoskeletal protein RodZ
MVRTNEGGSVLSFAVVGVILAILMIGGVVAVRQQSINSRKPAPAPQKVARVDKGKSATPAPSSSNNAPATPTPAPSKSETTTPAPQAAEPAPATKELPHTGPLQTLTTLLAVGLLTGSLVAYLQSRRYRLPSASI